MLKIPYIVGHKEIEHLLRQLESIDPNDADISLHANTGFREPGSEAALAQFLTTWARKAPSRALHLTRGNAGDEKASSGWLNDFAKSHHGLVALALGVEVVCDNGAPCTQEAYRVLKDRLSTISTSDVNQIALINAISLMCADEVPDVFLSSFYHAPPDGENSLKSFDEFEDVADDLLSYPERIEGLFPVDPKKKKDPGRSLVARILYELFKNTHDHTRRLWDGSLNPLSIRGVFVARHTLTFLEWKKNLESCQPLASYVEAIRSGLNRAITVAERLPPKQEPISATSRLTLMEISITDNGSGLAQHYLHSKLAGSTISLKEEYRAVLECFNKHASSTLDPTRGLGLHRVLYCLSELGGFVGIRTGRLNLYRDLLLRPYKSSQIFLDWDVGGPAYQSHPMTQGTVVTVLIPVRSYE